MRGVSLSLLGGGLIGVATLLALYLFVYLFLSFFFVHLFFSAKIKLYVIRGCYISYRIIIYALKDAPNFPAAFFQGDT